ncbi:MAG TPA: DUF1007 family protein [Hyphomicrobiales bacterium]|jgi:ABC-type uncharacterized transport system substrate-binding protein
MMMRYFRYIALLWIAAAFAEPFAACAHPHVFVEGKVTIIFDGNKRIKGIRNVWQFDKGYSAFAVVGLDTNGDGKLSPQELAPLAKVNVDSLAEYAYFTYLTIDKTQVAFKPPVDYFLVEGRGQLTLYFTLPLDRPASVTENTLLEVFDREYFIAFHFPEKDAVKLTHAPPGCSAAFHPPGVLDAATVTELAAIPADQRNLPPALQNAAVGLTNLFTVACPG